MCVCVCVCVCVCDMRVCIHVQLFTVCVTSLSFGLTVQLRVSIAACIKLHKIITRCWSQSNTHIHTVCHSVHRRNTTARAHTYTHIHIKHTRADTYTQHVTLHCNVCSLHWEVTLEDVHFALGSHTGRCALCYYNQHKRNCTVFDVTLQRSSDWKLALCTGKAHWKMCTLHWEGTLEDVHIAPGRHTGKCAHCTGKGHWKMCTLHWEMTLEHVHFALGRDIGRLAVCTAWFEPCFGNASLEEAHYVFEFSTSRSTPHSLHFALESALQFKHGRVCAV